MPIPTNDQIAEAEKQLAQMKIANWLAQDLFSPVWWLMLAMLVIPWLIWWKYVDRNRILQITLYGMLVLILSSYLDAIGSELVLWQYNRMLIPLWSRLVAVDFSVMPVTYMFVYQYFRSWPTFALASVAVGAVYAFLAEPVMIRLGIYQLNEWSHWYSLVIYIVMALSLRLLVDKLSAQAGRAR